jgi:deazaflavin-dependent oxidoreductase (nitroreductase family)
VRPGPLHRLLFRIPLWLHRLGVHGLERQLAGVDWIVVTTRGRRSGRPHTVVLDVQAHDPDTGTWYVQPAYHPAADWVRNVAADPRVTIEVRGRRLAARAVDVTGPVGATALLRFVQAHPRYARAVVRLRGVPRLDLPEAELRPLLARVPVLAFVPEPGGPR